MPSRIIREEYLTSDAVDALAADEECFFFRLMLKADDHGRFSANPKLLKSALYPLKDGVRDTDIARKLAAAEQAGVVRCYEVDNKRYLVIPKFRQRTRTPSKYPDPPPDICPSNDGQMTVKCPSNDGLGVVVVGCVFEGEGSSVGSSSADPPRAKEPGPAAIAAPTPAPLKAQEQPKAPVMANSPPLTERWPVDRGTNKPPLSIALKWFEKLAQDTEERFVAEEVRECYRTFEAACDRDGNWMWGRRMVGDWRAAMLQRMSEAREKRGGRKPPQQAADAIMRSINKVRVNQEHVEYD